ncbi:MAG: 50S ribosomal protein L13 [Arsenophonus sp.]|nr:MAG: 50S ribosomal protein L13 [Arsenophonus sp.]
MKTFNAKLENITRNWYIIDAEKKKLGYLSSKVVHYLKGKHKVEYTPHVDVGDFIIIINAKKIVLTGKKKIKKIYYRHSGYVGGLKKRKFNEVISKNPEYILQHSIKGMLPKGPLGRIIYRKLKIYSDDRHFHNAQKPKFLEI